MLLITPGVGSGHINWCYCAKDRNRVSGKYITYCYPSGLDSIVIVVGLVSQASYLLFNSFFLFSLSLFGSCWQFLLMSLLFDSDSCYFIHTMPASILSDTLEPIPYGKPTT